MGDILSYPQSEARRLSIERTEEEWQFLRDLLQAYEDLPRSRLFNGGTRVCANPDTIRMILDISSRGQDAGMITAAKMTLDAAIARAELEHDGSKLSVGTIFGVPLYIDARLGASVVEWDVRERSAARAQGRRICSGWADEEDYGPCYS